MKRQNAVWFVNLVVVPFLAANFSLAENADQKKGKVVADSPKPSSTAPSGSGSTIKGQIDFSTLKPAEIKYPAPSPTPSPPSAPDLYSPPRTQSTAPVFFTPYSDIVMQFAF